MPDTPIKNVLVIGATGSVGPEIVRALRSHPQNYTVSILTRPSSVERTHTMFPDPKIRILSVDYSSASVRPEDFEPAFRGQEAIVSCTATFTTSQQRAIIDASIASKSVRRFVPSEFGVDTSDRPALETYLPAALPKKDIVEYLKEHESQLSWSAICVGAFFDWGFSIPGLHGINLSARTATLFDGGNIEFEATNLPQIGHAVANTLSATPSPGFPDGSTRGLPMSELTKNRYVYVNSFTTTQLDVLHLLEKAIGAKLSRHSANLAELSKDGIHRARVSMPNFTPTTNSDYADGVTEMITAVLYGYSPLNQFSKTKGLWNQALALPQDGLKETIDRLFTR